ncbi:MAG: transglycosylase SLT domain-containing protein [Deltaproteobacteria bacterium]|nr:transglycosylase SLT domain-containing protein [Deltaproteobacteria bacterium]
MILLAGSLALLAYWPDRLPAAHGETATASSGEPWSEGGVLRVGSPEPLRQASVLSPYGPGFEFELVSVFCAAAAAKPVWVAVADKDTGLAMLERREIDLLVGFWGDTQRSGESGGRTGVTKGKAYAHFNPVRISGATVPRPDGESTDDGKDPRAQKPRSVIEALAWTFSSILSAFGDTPGQDKEGQPFPVFSFVTDGRGDGKDIVLLDPASYALWLPFMGDVNSRKVGQTTPYRWFWRNDDSVLAERLEQFWKDPARDAEVAELTERYFGFLPNTLRQRDILELAEALATRLSKYETFITNAAKETGVPPLLLVAAIYQESRFDPDAVSETKVRGIMQLTAATAEMLGVDRTDPEQCIMGGARYLRDLWERVGEKAANDWDRWFMALAAYNQGMSNLNRTIRLAREMGKKGNNWADLKQAFPLLTNCRGVEAKSFVERIRYYNFILHGLVALAPAETQDFAPLLGLAVADADF